MRIGFAGAGGTGKTSVMELLIKETPTLDLKRIPSVSRDFYALKGVTNEAEHSQNMTADLRKQFQFEMMDYFIARFNRDTVGVTNFISDRTALDHLAYCIYQSPTLTLSEYKEIKEKAIQHTLDNFDIVFFFPYPVSFSKDVDPDSFRYAPPNKNIIIHNLIKQYLNECYNAACSYGDFGDWDGFYYRVVEDLSVEERVQNIIS